MISVVMGVCGSGKTTIGMLLASKLSCEFRDADSFHSEDNKTKMTNGIPLTDEDRLPWLLSIYKYISDMDRDKKDAVITCSALKKSYREILRQGVNNTSHPKESDITVKFKLVYLKGDIDVLGERMKNREGHFMPASLLASQLATIEDPDDKEDCLTVDIRQKPEWIVNNILRTFQ